MRHKRPHAVEVRLERRRERAVSDDTGFAAGAALTLRDIWRAQAVIHPYVYHTPLLPSRTLSVLSGASEAR